jgi:hypothetical protein
MAARKTAAERAAEAQVAPVAHDTIHLAYHAAQLEMPAIQRDAINPHLKNKYASLASIIPTVLDVAGRHGLSVLQLPAQLDGALAVRTTLIHAATGDTYSEVAPCPTAGKDTGHAAGSGLTYMRRYAITALFGLVTEADDDANGASAPSEASQTPPPVTPAPAGATTSDDLGGEL